MKRLLLIAALLLLSKIGLAQTLSGANGDCTIGGQQALTSGLPSTATQQIGTTNVLPGAGVQASFPNCSVTVYATGTLTKATIYSTSGGGTLSNPFTANVDGSWTFFVAPACPGYDIVISSGTGPALPYTRTYADVCLGGSGSSGGGITGATIGGGLVQTSTTLGLRLDCGPQGIVLYNGTAWVCGDTYNVINVKNFGALGNGTTDDTSAIQAAYNSCPQVSPTIGCNVYWPAGTYKVTTAINQALLKGVHSFGEGACGTGGCTTTIQTNGAIYGFIIGNGTSPNTSGFSFENIGFQDMTANGLGGLDILATRDGIVNGVGCFNYSVGACIQPDGASNFTQFITLDNIYSWMTKYRIQTKGKTASNTVMGGEGNCQTSTDVINGSIDIDLGYTFNTASTGTASEWVITSQTQNCQIGRAIFNGGGNKFVGDKADEINITARPNGSFGIIVDGDTASLANGNSFVNEQVTKAGTGIYLKPFATNTIIDNAVFNGTNGVDLVEDANAFATTRISATKAFTGWTTNIATIARATNIVTATTTANSDNGNLSILPGTLLYVYNVSGGTTSFDGTFPVTSVSTNDSTGVTTFTWAQTGANESGTITPFPAGCGGLGSCVTPQSTILNSGVGVLQLTGEQITQDQTFQVPVILPTVCLSTTGRTFFDGSFFDQCEANGGILHLSDGPASRYTGSTSQTYSPQPTTTAGNGVAGVPNCSALITPNPQQPVPCPSSDDKGHLVATNTNGSTLCLPPPGVANGYPPRYSISVSFAPGTGPNALSVTPPGETSLYGITCPGTIGPTLDTLLTPRNLTIQQGLAPLWTDGNNWFTTPGQTSVPLDQIQPALTTNNVALQAGSWNGAGSAGQAGANFSLGAGNTNDSTGQAGSITLGGNGTGHAPASGLNGATQVIQTFQAGASTTGKEGSIARLCADFVSDCSASVHVQKNAVRITISDSGDTYGAIGIISSGASIGNPTEVVINGIYPAPGQTPPVSENSCTANEFFLISQVSSSTNGRGYCSVTDSPLRVGLTAAATTGTCNTSTPCNVSLFILPAGTGSGSTNFTAGGDLSGSNTSQEVTGILSNNLPSLAVGCLQWTGSALAWGTCGGSSSITINNGTGITGGGTGGAFTLGLVAPAVLNNQSNTFGAFLQTFQGNILLTPGSDPGSPSQGQEWYNSTLGPSWYDGANKRRAMAIDTPWTLAQANNGTPTPGQLMTTSGTGGSAIPVWINPGTVGCYFILASGPSPAWDTKLCTDGTTLTWTGTGGIVAQSFTGLVPWSVQSSIPTVGCALPGTGKSGQCVNNDGNFYLSPNNTTFGQTAFFPTGQVLANQVLSGSGPGTFNVDTLTNCTSSTCALGYNTTTHHFTTNTIVASGNLTGTLTLGQRIVASGTNAIAVSGPTFYADQAPGATIDAQLIYCLTNAAMLNSSPGTCDASAISTGLTTAATVNLAAGQLVILPPQHIVLGTGFLFTSSGSNAAMICRQHWQCWIDGSNNGSAGLVNFSGNYDLVQGIHFTGGRILVQSGTEVQMSGIHDVVNDNWLEDAGTYGFVCAGCNQSIFSNNLSDRSGKAGFYVNAGTGLTAYDNQFLFNECRDCNTLDSGDGGEGTASSGGLGFTNGTLWQGNVDRNLYFNTTPCNGLLTTLATGCSEAFQSTDKTVNTAYVNNRSYNSYRESFANSGTGNRLIGNLCVNPALVGGGGNGCYMISLTHNGGLEGGIIGDAIFTGNTAINTTGGNSSAYAFSVQAGASTTATTFQNIVIADNVVDGSVVAFGTGIRWSNAGSGNMTLTNLDFHDNQIVGATAVTTFSTGSTTIGAPRSANNSTGTPTCAFTSGGGTSPSCALDTGSSDSSGIIIATTGTGSPAGTGTITLTFTVAQGYNKPSCKFMASDGGAGTWGGLAVMKDKTPATTSDLFTFTNGPTPTALSASTAYWINYQCTPK